MAGVCGQKSIALAGNPNVGKSTLFNALTGLHQHTGNWPGKTVELTNGHYTYKGEQYTLTDLPGTYSMLCCSQEETVAAEYICSEAASCTLVVCDATCLERTLMLALQIMELTDSVVLCVNLMDEARRKGLAVDCAALSRQLGVPVIATQVGDDGCLEQLRETLREVCDGYFVPHPHRTLPDGGSLCGSTQKESDRIASLFQRRAQMLAQQAVGGQLKNDRDRRLDRIFAGKLTGWPILMLLLFAVFWLTIQGANYPSQLLQTGFDRLGGLLHRWLAFLPGWLLAPLLDGVYATTARVVAVMLPPMAIFFPLFTLLESFGYLPRAAFLTDCFFARAGTCGKQALTTAMGFGCNAAGVTGCRIINSPRERLIAVLTNSFVPCNGRFPGLIVLCAMLCSGSLGAAGLLTGSVILAVAVSLGVSFLLSRTLLRGKPSSFALELPPYRRPQFKKVIVRSMLDRTLYVLGRAVAVAAPAGLVIWLLANCRVGDTTILAWLSALLQPAGLLLGLNGVLLLAFVLALPANELVLPVALLIFSAGTSLAGAEQLQIAPTLAANGVDAKTAVCMIVFFLFHWPCATTLLTIRKETGGVRWALLAAALPTAVGVLLCMAINLLWR